MSINMAPYFKEVIYNEMIDYQFRLFQWAISHQTEADINRFRSYQQQVQTDYQLFACGLSKEVVNGAAGLNRKIPQYKNWLRWLDERKIGRWSTPEDLFIMSCLSFSHTLNFKVNGYASCNYGFPLWKDYARRFYPMLRIHNLKVSNHDFRWFTNYKFRSHDTVYFDPPYLGTGAHYNKYWTNVDEKALYVFCENLNRQNVRWYMSNTFANKWGGNLLLRNWCKDRGWYVHQFDHNYSLRGPGYKSVEVLVTNRKHFDHGEPQRFSFEVVV